MSLQRKIFTPNQGPAERAECLRIYLQQKICLTFSDEIHEEYAKGNYPFLYVDSESGPFIESEDEEIHLKGILVEVSHFVGFRFEGVHVPLRFPIQYVETYEIE